MPITNTKVKGGDNAFLATQELINLYLAAGINPKNGLPTRVTDCPSKENIKKLLRIVDEQDAVNRYIWHNIPANITSQELERLLYYKGQLCFFYEPTLDQFFFMPYALDGTIDFYGRFNTIHPVPISDGTTKEEKAAYKAQADFLATRKLKVLYDVPLEEVKVDEVTVILNDYTKQLSETLLTRQTLQDPLLDIMSECIPYLRTAMRNSTGVQGIRVNNEDEAANVTAANMATDGAALNGQRYIPIIGQIDFQDLAGGEALKADQYLMAMQSLDNFRLSLYGLANGGLFQKSDYQNRMQTAMNGAGVTGTPLTDGLKQRQHFADIVNAITNAGMWVEIAETASMVDTNGDGFINDNEPVTNDGGNTLSQEDNNVQ
jgi:hypothetical protein